MSVSFARTTFVLLIALVSVALAPSARAQVGGFHILGTGELAAPAPPPVSQAPPPSAPAAVPTPAVQQFVLRGVVIEGASSVPPATLRTAWAPALGHQVNSADLSLIARRIGELENEADIALYLVSFPPQNLAGGIVHISVHELSVGHVVIGGQTKGERLGLLEAYSQHILASKPLKRSVLERNILMMGDLAGAKVGSTFRPLPGRTDAVELVLTVEQTKLFGGFNVNNQGVPVLGNTQGVVNAGVNNLLREGERTQLVFGMPFDLKRYQYYGLNDTEPLGHDGLVLTGSIGELATHPDGSDLSDGSAQLASVRLGYPLIRALHTNLIVTGGLDYVNSQNAYNSSNALLNAFSTNEKTRTLRAGLSYNDDKYFNGVDRAGITLSDGVGILGAQRANPYLYGAPEFLKAGFNVERLQALPYGFALRLAGIAQISSARLPPSEEFDYGGPEYGAAFTASELEGDSGIAGVAMLAHPLPRIMLPKELFGTSIFALVDYGEVWNRRAPAFAEPVPANTQTGASFAAGVKVDVINKLDLTLGVATPIVKPQDVGQTDHYRFVFATSGHF